MEFDTEDQVLFLSFLNFSLRRNFFCFKFNYILWNKKTSCFLAFFLCFLAFLLSCFHAFCVFLFFLSCFLSCWLVHLLTYCLAYMLNYLLANLLTSLLDYILFSCLLEYLLSCLLACLLARFTCFLSYLLEYPSHVWPGGGMALKEWKVRLTQPQTKFELELGLSLAISNFFLQYWPPPKAPVR